MRFTGVYTGSDERRVFEFRAGADELKLIRDAVKRLHKEIPPVIGTTRVRSQLHNIEYSIDRAVAHELDEVKNPIKDISLSK